MSKRRKRYKRNKSYQKQLGGVLGGLFGAGGGGNFLSSISEALQAFNNEPAMQGILGQSNNLLGSFKTQAEQAGVPIDEDKYKGIFDLASLFTSNAFGRSIFDDGGYVAKGKKLRGEMTQRFGAITDAAIDFQHEQNLQTAKHAYNQAYGDKGASVMEIIPGSEPKIKETGVTNGGQMRRGGRSKRMYQGGGLLPVSPLGQFAYPNQPVIVPSPSGQITMDGVDQPLLAVDDLGNQYMLPANSGTHQLMPGSILEIPFEQPKPRKRRRKRRKKGTPQSVQELPHRKMKDTLSHRMANVTQRNFNKRNRDQMRKNRMDNIGLPFAKRKYGSRQ